MHLLCWRQTLLGQWTNLFCTSDEQFSAGDERIQNLSSNFSPPTHTSDFKTELASRLLLTGTHLRKRALGNTLLYSPSSTLHPQLIYAVAFSAGLNGLQVH